MSPLIVFLISIIIVVVSADYLVKSSVRLSASLALSPLVIGATVVALGTSLPELSVAVTSISQDVPNLSLGDVIGSNIGNVGLILGLSILLTPFRIGTEKTQRNNVILVMLTFSFVALQILPFEIRRILSPFLLFFAFIFILLEVLWGRKGMSREDLLYFLHLKKPAGSTVNSILILTISLGGLVLGSRFLVQAAQRLASSLAIDDETFGLSILAVGTSLPELTFSLVSGIKKEDKLLLGDILGSNILNLAFVGSLVSLFAVNFGAAHYYSLFYLIFFTLSLFILLKIFRGRQIPRFWGVFFLLVYSTYLWVIYRVKI